MSTSILIRCIHIVCCLLYIIPTSVCNECDITYEGVQPIKTKSAETTRYVVYHVCEVDSFPLYLEPRNFYYSHPYYDIIWIQLSTTRVISGRIVENEPSAFRIGEIHIENQHLEKLFPTAFGSLSNLQEIRLSRNNLTNIEDGSFNIPSLEILDLSSNKIRHFSRFSLMGASNLKLLNLSSNFLQLFEALPSIHSPHLSMDLSFNELTNFEFEENSRNTEKLNLSHNSLTEIRDCFPACTVINLSNNKLRSIANVSCSSTTKGTLYINLGSNLLSELGAGLFDEMPTLKDLFLDQNNFTSFPNGIFARLHSLELLNVSHNHLNNIDQDSFEDLASLLFLDLSDNNVSELKSGLFDKVTSLKYLHLNQNNFTSFPNETLAKLQYLELLNISYNHLKTIEQDSFKYLESLLFLDLSENNVSEIKSGLFDKITNLKYLYLNQNNFTSFPTETFANLHSLEYLNISHNHLKKLQVGLFEPLVNLVSLDVSYNEVSEIKSFQHSLHKLEELNVEFNELNHLDFDSLLVDLPYLKRLALDGNEFSCKGLIEIFRNLKKKIVLVPYGHARAVANIYGIKCYENESSVVETKLGSEDVEEAVLQRLARYMGQTISNKKSTEEYCNGCKQFSTIGTVNLIFQAMLIFVSGFTLLYISKMYNSYHKHGYNSREEVELINS